MTKTFIVTYWKPVYAKNLKEAQEIARNTKPRGVDIDRVFEED